MWEFFNGPIPDGFEVHHKDGNTLNNVLDNFELVTHPEHAKRHHWGVWEGSKEHLAKLIPIMAKRTREIAATPEGHARLVEQGKKSWENKPLFKKSCETCGKEYSTPFPSRSRYCHLNCKMRALRKRLNPDLKPYEPRGHVNTRPDLQLKYEQGMLFC